MLDETLRVLARRVQDLELEATSAKDQRDTLDMEK
jgi:hypothetical protein